MESIDVFIPTYNSSLHLGECIRSVRGSLPVRRIVVVDHHSTDGTPEIAERNGCEVVFEDEGLAYARELCFEMAETETFAMVESDLVYGEFGWYRNAKALLSGKVAAVVIFVPRNPAEPRGKYSLFWSRHTPLKGREHGFSAGSTVFRKEATEGLKVPKALKAYEDVYIMRHLARNGWSYKWIEAGGVHYSDLDSPRKARWFGANARLLHSIDPSDYSLLRRHLVMPLKGAVAAFGTRDARVLTWSLSYAVSFLLGWTIPKKFSTLHR